MVGGLGPAGRLGEGGVGGTQAGHTGSRNDLGRPLHVREEQAPYFSLAPLVPCLPPLPQAPALPEVNMRGALSRAMRQRHPDAPERVQWHAGVLLPHGVKLTNGSWSPRHDW